MINSERVRERDRDILLIRLCVGGRVGVNTPGRHALKFEMTKYIIWVFLKSLSLSLFIKF